MSKPDHELFLKEMADVARLSSDDRVMLDSANRAPSAAQLARREAAQQVLDLDPSRLASEAVELVAPDDIVEFRRDGVQSGVWRCLKRGDYEAQARLDLHHSALEQAKRQLYEFVRDCQQMDLRTVLVHHGKGQGSTPPALVKSYVAKWLRQIPEVMAYHSARHNHGGVAAVYVLLRKSERQKQVNRELHRKGR